MRRNSHHQGQLADLADQVQVDVRCAPDPVPGHRPVLSREWHPLHGECWVLCYVDELESPRRQHFPGRLAEVDSAVEAATEFLAPLGELRARRAAAVATLLTWGGPHPGSPASRAQHRFIAAGVVFGLVVAAGTVLWTDCHPLRSLAAVEERRRATLTSP